MKSGVKTAVSLLISVVVFVGLTLAASLGMFSSIEKSFYEPAKIKAVRSSLDQIAVCSNEYISSLLKATGPSYGGFMSEADAGTFVSQKPSDKIIKSWYSLQERFPELEGIRVIDASGRRIHYSSFKSDSKLNGQKRIFSYYPDVKTPYGTDELDYSLINATVKNEADDSVSAPENPWKKGRFTFDSHGQRIILSYPMENDGAEYTVAFYYNLQGLKNVLARKSLISMNEMVLLVSDEECSVGGLAFNVSKMNGAAVAPYFIDFWNRNVIGPEGVFIKNVEQVPKSKLSNSQDDEEEQPPEEGGGGLVEDKPDFLFMSDSENRILRVGGLYDTGLLTLPEYVRILLLGCAFITVCLFVLILFCFKKDDEVVIKNKVKRFQLELLNEYFSQDINRAQIAGKLQAGKEELSNRIKKDLGRRGKRHSVEVDAMLEHSWNDIISALVGNGSENLTAAIDMVQLKNMLQEIISSGTLKVQAVEQTPVQQQKPLEVPVPAYEPSVSVPQLEDAEPVEEAEEVEEIEDAEPVEDAEEVEEFEDAEPVEETYSKPQYDIYVGTEPLRFGLPKEVIDEKKLPAESVDDGFTISSPVSDFLIGTVFAENSENLPSDDSFEGTEDLSFGEPSCQHVASETEGEIQVVSPENEIIRGFAQMETPTEQKMTEAKQEVEVVKEVIGIENNNEEEKVQIDEKETNVREEDAEPEFEEMEKVESAQLMESDDAENAELMEAEDAEPVSSISNNISNSSQFVFTTFAANNNNITDLPPDVIVEDADGVFSITRDADDALMPPSDISFKELVDSVLR
ncbi:MAG: hypothetical protein UHP28_02185 [Treponema sp.]|nr:hypothetical protein [Treponema sp.]